MCELQKCGTRLPPIINLCLSTVLHFLGENSDINNLYLIKRSHNVSNSCFSFRMCWFRWDFMWCPWMGCWSVKWRATFWSVIPALGQYTCSMELIHHHFSRNFVWYCNPEVELRHFYLTLYNTALLNQDFTTGIVSIVHVKFFSGFPKSECFMEMK